MTVAEKTGDGDGYVAWLEKRSRTGSLGNHGDGWHREEAEAQEAGQQRRGPSLQRAEDDAGRSRTGEVEAETRRRTATGSTTAGTRRRGRGGTGLRPCGSRRRFGSRRRRRSSPIPIGSGERESGGASGGVPRVFPPRGDKAGVDRPSGPGGPAWPVS